MDSKQPNEKAKELIEKFLTVNDSKNQYIDLNQAKQCALIATVQIEEEIKNITPRKFQAPLLHYWDTVNKEILEHGK